MKLCVLFGSALLISYASAWAQEPKTDQKTLPAYRTESSASIIKGRDGRTYVTENGSFRFEEVLGDTGNYEAVVLLEETYHNERTSGMDGVSGKITAKAWTLKDGKDRVLRWRIEANGNEGDVRDRFFRVIRWGCCDVPAAYFY